MGAVEVISDTIQQYNGERFYLCGKYFQHKGKRLHVAVWTDANGTVPEGYQIHHIDENRANNNLDNLTLLSAKEHMRYHATKEDRREKGRQHAAEIRPMTKAWHASEEGRQWHSQNAKSQWEKKIPIEYECTFCGVKYTSLKNYSAVTNHFCSGKCKAAFRRKRLRDEGK